MIEPALNRMQQYVRDWGVRIEHSFETSTSLIAFGKRDDHPVVLKTTKQGDEWHAGTVLNAFQGHGVARVYEHAPGTVLMERLRPGNSLEELTANNRDEEATEIIADVIQRMSAVELTFEIESGIALPTVQDWARAFDRYLATEGNQIPASLVVSARRVYSQLCDSQTTTRLLHGDLHHYNILFDNDRGWLAIDPKGVIGELEYEIGAALRNPVQYPDRFLSPAVVARRLELFASKLKLDYQRALRWAFSQAVLSVIWEIEDDGEVNRTNSAVRLANVIQTISSDCGFTL
jgi:streptomycin 6-kinase